MIYLERLKEVTDQFEVRVETKFNKFLVLLCEVKKGVVLIHSETDIKRVLRQLKMESCRASSTTMKAVMILGKTICAKKEVSNNAVHDFTYIELVGSLLYLANTTTPDISYVVGILERYVKSPRK